MYGWLNPKVILAGILAVIAAAGAGYFKGRADANAKWELAVAAEQQKARAIEQTLQGEINAITKKSAAERDLIQRRLDIAVERLRHRPARLPEAARATCKGATGAELSREDGQFLGGEAARADKLREALTSCYQYLDTVREKTGI